MPCLILLGVLAHPELPPPTQPLPRGVLESLEHFGYPIPAALPPDRLARADFDGNGRDDWALLVYGTPGNAAILVAYKSADVWRGSNVDIWSNGEVPTKITVLPPGLYERAPPHDRERQPNEREALESRMPGIIASLASGGRRGYQLGDHAWRYVYLGRAE